MAAKGESLTLDVTRRKRQRHYVVHSLHLSLRAPRRNSRGSFLAQHGSTWNHIHGQPDYWARFALNTTPRAYVCRNPRTKELTSPLVGGGFLLHADKVSVASPRCREQSGERLESTPATKTCVAFYPIRCSAPQVFSLQGVTPALPLEKNIE